VSGHSLPRTAALCGFFNSAFNLVSVARARRPRRSPPTAAARRAATRRSIVIWTFDKIVRTSRLHDIDVAIKQIYMTHRVTRLAASIAILILNGSDHLSDDDRVDPSFIESRHSSVENKS
jgi:hypothetical protein